MWKSRRQSRCEPRVCELRGRWCRNCRSSRQRPFVVALLMVLSPHHIWRSQASSWQPHGEAEPRMTSTWRSSSTPTLHVLVHGSAVCQLESWHGTTHGQTRKHSAAPDGSANFLAFVNSSCSCQPCARDALGVPKQVIWGPVRLPQTTGKRSSGIAKNLSFDLAFTTKISHVVPHGGVPLVVVRNLRPGSGCAGQLISSFSSVLWNFVFCVGNRFRPLSQSTARNVYKRDTATLEKPCTVALTS